MASAPPPIEGARRSHVTARGVRFHVTEAGPGDGRPVVALHGWPQHHWVYRDLLGDPPAGLRIIAPDLPGYGWSGPAPHRWEKDDVAADVLALLDALGLDQVLLTGHDWGAYVGYRMVLTAPERIDGFLAMNMAHPWITPRVVAPQLWRFWYQVPLATFGVPVQRYTDFVARVFRVASRMDSETARVYADRFKDPTVARAGRDTYRSFVLRELPAAARGPKPPRATVPIRCLFGLGDTAVHPSLAAEETADADDYRLQTVDASHFIIDERPDLVRAALIALASETAGV
ncbi:alpha/beta hydrolase [Mycobacterium sp. GA-1285]|uniref:alpha/beta fold hydrolase n=1 Tax=Mycobacterium sp. GA-1285 TaxID=1772282 RepID=UPI0007498F61|nr:alpha/beta hydrolase [Mycobacterium sp. GA-1285]KUI20178.1 alpha/beta hydrolase [Mycobacterium sp. GA-1285]